MDFSEFFSGFKNRSLWWRLAWSDMNQIYRRSILGIFWIAISFIMFIGVKIFIFSSVIDSVDPAVYSIWVIVGYGIWMFITHSVTDACLVFISARSWILGTRLSFGTFVAQNVMRHLITLFLISFIMIAAVLVQNYVTAYNWYLLTIIPAVLFLILNSIWVHIVFGVVAARFRDFMHLIRSIMHVMFFLTPILYMPGDIGPKAVVLNYNPFTHFIAIVREPIVNGRISELAWIVVISITIVGWMAALFLVKTKMRNVVFWI